MNLKPYPEYKESGVSWIGRVPENWTHYPGMAVLREKQIKNTGLKEKTILSLSYGRIKVKSQGKLHGLVPESFETYQIVEPGDIIIRSTDLQNDKTSLRTGKVKDKGIITSAYMCLKAQSSIDKDYAHSLLHALDIMKVYYGMGSGLRQNLSWTDFKRMPFFIPPLPEQTQIARFLDWKTSQIARFIKAKKQMIELLKEQKQVIINDAVTGKIDVTHAEARRRGEEEMKDSGVEWLGQVPEGWGVRYFFQSFNEKCIKNKGIIENNRLSLSYGEIIRKSIDSTEGLLPLSFETYQIVKESDIILRLTDLQNDHKSLRIGFVKEQGIITSAYLCLFCKDGIIPEFASGVLKSYDFRKVFYGLGGGVRQSIGFQELKRLPFLVPDLIEQKEILSWIIKRTDAVNISIFHIESEISLMQEYRDRLIADVVTGKVDVRGIEVPDVVEEIDIENGSDEPDVEELDAEEARE